MGSGVIPATRRKPTPKTLRLWKDRRELCEAFPGIISLRPTASSDERGFMAFVTGPKDGGEPREKELVERLRKIVEDSDLSFYKIASRIGTSGGILSMWLAETTRPRPEELDAIQKFLG